MQKILLLLTLISVVACKTGRPDLSQNTNTPTQEEVFNYPGLYTQKAKQFELDTNYFDNMQIEMVLNKRLAAIDLTDTTDSNIVLGNLSEYHHSVNEFIFDNPKDKELYRLYINDLQKQNQKEIKFKELTKNIFVKLHESLNKEVNFSIENDSDLKDVYLNLLILKEVDLKSYDLKEIVFSDRYDLFQGSLVLNAKNFNLNDLAKALRISVNTTLADLYVKATQDSKGIRVSTNDSEIAEFVYFADFSDFAFINEISISDKKSISQSELQVTSLAELMIAIEEVKLLHSETIKAKMQLEAQGLYKSSEELELRQVQILNQALENGMSTEVLITEGLLQKL